MPSGTFVSAQDKSKVRVDCQKCVHCGKGTPEGVIVKAVDFDKYLNGAHVQEAFPYLSLGERELLITGTHSKCFDELFGDDYK